MRRYSGVMITLHWAMALLILVVWLTAESGREVREAPPLLHFSLGLSVLVLALPRVIARLIYGAPPVEADARPLLNLAAKIGHTVLYLLMIAVPITGWLAASRMGVPVSFLGLSVPALVPGVQGAPGPVAEFHEAAGTIILVLAGLHAVIALWHQFVLRDGTFDRMSPVTR